MTSLAGIAARNEPLDAMKAKSQVELMGQVQKHREPDGWRVVANAGLTYVSGQASTDSDESASGLALAFDGKLTNASEVREALRKAGTQFRSNSDRELVLRAWESWGPKCLEQLQGRFAFVLRDSKRGTSYLVRDRFGHKSFYYALFDDRIYFASEIKTLLALLSPPVLNELALVEWSLYGDVLPPRTLFRGLTPCQMGTCAKSAHEDPHRSPTRTTTLQK
jgi:asparagine synthase (glutamine-hydrolysing)